MNIIIVDILPSDGFKALIHHEPKVGLSVEYDGLAIIRWVFNMLLGLSDQTWMQSIKNRKLKKRVHCRDFLPSDASKPSSTKGQKRAFEMNMMELP